MVKNKLNSTAIPFDIKNKLIKYSMIMIEDLFRQYVR